MQLLCCKSQRVRHRALAATLIHNHIPFVVVTGYKRDGVLPNWCTRCAFETAPRGMIVLQELMRPDPLDGLALTSSEARCISNRVRART